MTSFKIRPPICLDDYKRTHPARWPTSGIAVGLYQHALLLRAVQYNSASWICRRHYIFLSPLCFVEIPLILSSSSPPIYFSTIFFLLFVMLSHAFFHSFLFSFKILTCINHSNFVFIFLLHNRFVFFFFNHLYNFNNKYYVYT